MFEWATSNSLIGVILSTSIGIFSAFAFIGISHALLAPRIIFSRDIRVSYDSYLNKFAYAIRIRKSGYIDLIDTRIQCRVFIKDVRKNGSGTINSYKIPTSWDDTLYIKSSARFIFLKIHDSKLLDQTVNPIFLRNTKINVPDVGIRFEDIFLSHEKTYVQIFILGHDRFTGIKKLFESPKYFFHNLREGQYNEMNIIESKGIFTTSG